MTGAEAFALLQLDPRPLLDPEAVAQAYRARALHLHPDRGGQKVEFQRLNTARTMVENPAARLAALAETLAATPHPAPSPSPELADLVFQAAAPLREAASLASLPLPPSDGILAAVRKAEQVRLTQRLRSLQTALNSFCSTLEARLRDLDSAWNHHQNDKRHALLPALHALRVDFLTADKLGTNLRHALTSLAIKEA